MITLREMHLDDLPLVRQWLSAPHVARWFLAGSTVEREVEDLRQSVTGQQYVHVLVVSSDQVPIGWCQWYLCEDDPQWASEIGADAGDVGIDFAIGDPEHVGRGEGTALVSALVEHVRTVHPRCAVLSDPDSRNLASRRVLEKNGFQLMAVTSIASEPTSDPVAVYRLPGPRSG